MQATAILAVTKFQQISDRRIEQTSQITAQMVIYFLAIEANNHCELGTQYQIAQQMQDLDNQMQDLNNQMQDLDNQMQNL